MATTAFATEPFEPSNDWNVTTDAFAPQPARRTVRGWDRAPVRAHAQHSQGKTVWKTLGSRQNIIKGTQDQSYKELEKEGTGSRKRSKIAGGKENIGNPAWDNKLASAERRAPISSIQPLISPLRDISSSSSSTPKTKTSTTQHQTVAHDANPVLKFVPRKRTNTNHVITPQKPLRQTTLNGHAKRQPVLESPFDTAKIKTSRPRKSLRNSVRRSTILNEAKLNDESVILGVVQIDQQPIIDIDHATKNDPRTPRAKEATKPRRSLRSSAKSTVVRMFQPDVLPTVQPLSPANQEATIVVALPEVISADDESRADQSSDQPETELSGASEVQQVQGVKIATMDQGITLVSNDSQPNVTEESPVSAQDNTEFDRMLPTVEDGQEISDEFCNLVSEIGKSELDPIIQPVLEDSKINTGNTIICESGDQKTTKLVVVAPLSLGTETVAAPAVNIQHEEPDIITDDTLEPTEGVSQGSPEQTLATNTTAKNAEQMLIAESSAGKQAEPPMVTQPPFAYDHDDTDMLRSFLTRVKANKAANRSPTRKRSLPHSPLRIPLGDMDGNVSPSPLKSTDEFNLLEPSPTKLFKKSNALGDAEEDDISESKSCRRSGRTRIPMKALAGAPSLIPVRRLGHDPETTVTLKRSEDKELAILTRVNTRKNKGVSLSVPEVLTKKADEKDDPVMRQRFLKEVFSERAEKGKTEKKGKGLTVVWAEELAQYQEITKGKVQGKLPNKASEQQPVGASEEKKKNSVRVGVRSKMALGMATNGTPAPKRKMRDRV